jgi:hypothetical protein
MGLSSGWTIEPNKPNRGTVRGSSHYDFADAAHPTEPPAARFLGSIGPIGQGRALEIARRYLRAFFDTYLKSQPDKLVQGASPDYPEVLIK